ncbi:sigma-70 family RNA polymerase sigma factor [Desulfofundulus sp. TPOSR]|uniref:RNA polymerase sigma factor n=1 Tax=Desulfofundulus sp. TPOSR TaxID=2714340 RepID=UPI00140B82A8|nr:sigma-70 family RNA polymerase sigma factor [Desulfofundulus sp. TPOSR]NHM27162.1 sigma-70 family RNA polymerase sigma factor [Desulfofundulus sp. TPOSR]
MWQELYRLTYRYFSGLGLTREDAEDLAQETLVAAYLHLDGVRPGKLRAWLFTVARHKYIDWLRRSPKGVVLVNFPAEELTDGVRGPEEAALAGAVRETVAAALNRLSPPERTLLALKYNLGLNTQEIASVLKIKPGTVKVRLFRARQKFKEEFIKLWEG